MLQQLAFRLFYFDILSVRNNRIHTCTYIIFVFLFIFCDFFSDFFPSFPPRREIIKLTRRIDRLYLLDYEYDA